MIAGAGAAYLNGGFGIWEFAFTAVVTYFAYRGLRSHNFIGIGWLFHTGWDVLHHLYGNPIMPFVPASSLGSAICDPVIAVWCFAGAPSLYHLFRRKMGTTVNTRGTAMTTCDLCGEAKDCLQKEIEDKEYDICSECWRELQAKLQGKGRVKGTKEIIFLPPPREPDEPEEKPEPGEPPIIRGSSDRPN